MTQHGRLGPRGRSDQVKQAKFVRAHLERLRFTVSQARGTDSFLGSHRICRGDLRGIRTYRLAF